MKLHAVAQVVNAAVMSMDNAMHFRRVPCFIAQSSRITQQVFGKMATGKACGSRQQHPHCVFLSKYWQNSIDKTV
jgi:hypothetical protein